MSTVAIPTGISASGQSTTTWVQALIRQATLDNTNPTYLRRWQLNNSVLLLTAGTNSVGIPLEALVPMLAAIVPQITVPPTITSQPQSQTTTAPAGTAFAVTATGEMFNASLILPITYQWQYLNSGTWTNTVDGTIAITDGSFTVSGSATDSLTVSATTNTTGDSTAISASLRCVCTNASGSTNSATVVLTINHS